MRQYKDKEKEVVISRECIEAACDMCGRKADYPEDIDWGGFGRPTTPRILIGGDSGGVARELAAAA
ncbi:MAG: hypothetical protein ACYTBJ_16075 [Planctomycetota bacterium]|jgi:hypothetical protein